MEIANPWGRHALSLAGASPGPADPAKRWQAAESVWRHPRNAGWLGESWRTTDLPRQPSFAHHRNRPRPLSDLVDCAGLLLRAKSGGRDGGTGLPKFRRIRFSHLGGRHVSGKLGVLLAPASRGRERCGSTIPRRAALRGSHEDGPHEPRVQQRVVPRRLTKRASRAGRPQRQRARTDKAFSLAQRRCSRSAVPEHKRPDDHDDDPRKAPHHHHPLPRRVLTDGILASRHAALVPAGVTTEAKNGSRSGPRLRPPPPGG